MNRRQRWRAAVTGLRHAAAALSAFYVALVVWLSVIALAPAVLGWSPYVITSGSMAPRIPAGTVLVAGPPPEHLVAPGGVVVFTDAAGRTVSHRVVAVDEQGRYRTRGDANPLVDTDPVGHDQLRGVGRIVVPLLGLPVVWALQGRWLLTALAVAASVLACLIAWRTIGAGQRPPRTAHDRATTAPRAAVPAGTLAGLALLGGMATVATAAFAAEAQQPANRWVASESFDQVATSASAGDLPRAAASASQAFTFTSGSDLPPGAEVRIDLTEPFRGPVDYRGAAQPASSVGTAVLETRRGASHLREAEIVWVAPAAGLAAGEAVTITIPEGIQTADVEVDGLPATFTSPVTGETVVALFAVR